MFSRLVMALFIIPLLALFVVPAEAVLMDAPIREYLYQGDNSDLDKLSAEVQVDVVGSTLTLKLTNTMTESAGNAAGNLLSGVGFTLPTGVSISTSGTHSLTGAGFVNTDGSGLTAEWGYDNNPLASGPFLNLAETVVNTAVSTLMASVERDFTNTTAPPANVNGPSWGVVADASFAGGQKAVLSMLTIDIELAGVKDADAVKASIIRNGVVVSFGSPTATSIPEPASLAVWSLLGLTMAGGWFVRKRRQAA